MRDPLTYRYPRTTHGLWPCDATEAVAIHIYRTPLYKRVLFFCCRHGWFAIVPGLLVAIFTEL